jgi:hypothetical protein
MLLRGALAQAARGIKSGSSMMIRSSYASAMGCQQGGRLRRVLRAGGVALRWHAIEPVNSAVHSRGALMLSHSLSSTSSNEPGGGMSAAVVQPPATAPHNGTPPPPLAPAAARVYSSQIQGSLDLLRQLDTPPAQYSTGVEYALVPA